MAANEATFRKTVATNAMAAGRNILNSPLTSRLVSLHRLRGALGDKIEAIVAA
jgi:hypothetical protein